MTDTPRPSLTYAEAGVDIDAGNAMVERIKPFVRATWEPFTLAFATANSEAALPTAFERMERLGVPRGIVGLLEPMKLCRAQPKSHEKLAT